MKTGATIFDALEQYFIDDSVETKGVRLTDEFSAFIKRHYGHWHGQFDFVVDDNGYIVGYEYLTYEEQEIWQSNDIRSQIEDALRHFKSYY